MSATANAAKSTPRRKTPPAARTTASRPPATPAVPSDDQVLEFSSAPAEEDAGEREVLFRVDGKEYTIPVDPPATIALKALEVLAAHNGSQIGWVLASRQMFSEMLGAEGYAALLGVPGLKAADFTHLSAVCSARAMAAIQGDEASPNR